MNNPQNTLNLKEVAELLGMSERTIYNWVQKKYIPSFKLGKSWRFNKSEILNWMESNRSAETPDTTIMSYGMGTDKSNIKYNLSRSIEPNYPNSNPMQYYEMRADGPMSWSGPHENLKQEENKNLLLKKCLRCNSSVTIVVSKSHRNPDRKYYKCLGVNNCWIGWVDEFKRL